jgi:hypothetical protein
VGSSTLIGSFKCDASFVISTVEGSISLSAAGPPSKSATEENFLWSWSWSLFSALQQRPVNQQIYGALKRK